MSNRNGTSGVKQGAKMVKSPQKRIFVDSDDQDDDGVKGFTLRLTQVQVSEEKKVTSSAKKNKYGSSSHYRNGSMAGAYADHEIEDEALYNTAGPMTRVNTLVCPNGGFTIKSSNKKRKIINVPRSPARPQPLVFEERKAHEGNDIEMISIGSNLRLEHLEEQQLRTSNKGSSAAKPPKVAALKKASFAGTMSSSGADDSTSGGGYSQSDNSGQELNQSMSSSMGSNGPLTNQMLIRSPAAKKKTVSKLIVQLTKDGSPVKGAGASSPAKEMIINSHKKRAEEVKEFKRSLCYKALEQAVMMGEDLVEREDEIEGMRKLELDTDQGATTCRTFLICVERLYEILAITPVSKEYREKFSKAYKVLYS
jgi:hypothetical protein